MYIRGRPVQLFVPTSMNGTYALSKVSPAPQLRPKIEWVYGYRGRDARSNLYLLPTGEIVYFVGKVLLKTTSKNNNFGSHEFFAKKHFIFFTKKNLIGF